MFDSECAYLADHFLDNDEERGDMSDEDYAKHRDRLAQEIQFQVELFCEFDKEWVEAKQRQA